MTLLRREGWTRWPTEVPSNPDHSVILWFCDSAILRFCDSVILLGFLQEGKCCWRPVVIFLSVLFFPLCCVIWSKSGSVTYQGLIGAYSFYSVNFASNASATPGLKEKLDIWWAFVAVHWAAAGGAVHVPLPFSLLETGQPSTTIWFIKNTSVRPVAAPWCWEMFTSWGPAPPDGQVALLVTKNGAGLKTGGVHKRKTAVWGKSALSDPAWGSPGDGAG